MNSKQREWKFVEEAGLRAEMEAVIRECMTRLQTTEEIRVVLEQVEQETDVPQKDYYFEWNQLSLGRGAAGLCLLHGALDREYPSEGWDLRGHAFLEAVNREMNREGVASLSAFGGLSGVGYAAVALSREGSRYQGVISQINTALLPLTAEASSTAVKQLEYGVPAADYDVISGLTGIGRFLLKFSDRPDARERLLEILDYLVLLCGEEVKEGAAVPRWCTPSQHLFLPEERKQFPEGIFNVGLSHGIAGPLALLSLTLQDGLEVSGQREAVTQVANFLMEYRQSDQYGWFWPSRFSVEEWRTGKLQTHIDRGAWCYGTPGTARALWMAGAAMGNEEWKNTALDAYRAVFWRECIWSIHSPTLCHGMAGLLQMTQRMYVESGAEDLAVCRDRLLKRILAMFERKAPFGFYELVQDHNRQQVQVHLPGLLEGAAGTVLVLLSLLSKREPEWDQVLLMS